MKAAIVWGNQGLDTIQLRDRPVPIPHAGEALVRLRAATLNYRDLIIAKGLIPGLVDDVDVVPLACAVGEVISVAEGVTRVKPGDRVSPLYIQGWIDGPPDGAKMLGARIDGVAREYGAFDAESLVLIPDELGDLEAATLPCAGLTAFAALFGARSIQPGEWVLVQGTGGVAIAALQWAKAAGAHVAITSSSDAKLTRARGLGADLAVNYRATPDWAAAIRAALGGKGVDIALDVLGTTQLQATAGLVNPGGMIAAIGMLEGPFSWSEPAIDGVPIVPISVGNRHQHEAMLAFAAEHGVRPVVDVVYPLDRLADAMRHLESGKFFGKIALSLCLRQEGGPERDDWHVLEDTAPEPSPHRAVRFDWDTLPQIAVTEILGLEPRTMSNGSMHWDAVAICLGEKAVVITVDMDTDQVWVDLQACPEGPGWEAVPTLAFAVGKTLGWYWVGINSQGYKDSFSMDFSDEGLTPRCMFVAASGLQCFDLSPHKG